jgi:hypothetical protein
MEVVDINSSDTSIVIDKIGLLTLRQDQVAALVSPSAIRSSSLRLTQEHCICCRYPVSNPPC